MHKICYKNGWLKFPKELIDLSAHENVVFIPWMTESVILMTEEEFQNLAETLKSMEENAKYVMRRIIAQASLIEVEDDKVMLPKFYQEWMKIDKKEEILEGSFWERKDIKGIQIQKTKMGVVTM